MRSQFLPTAGARTLDDLNRERTDDLIAVHQRITYTLALGAIALVTGEVGAGKSTALRWVCGQLHPSKFRVLWVTATSGSILELYRQLLAQLDIRSASSSRAILSGHIRSQVLSSGAGQKAAAASDR